MSTDALRIRVIRIRIIALGSAAGGILAKTLRSLPELDVLAERSGEDAASSASLHGLPDILLLRVGELGAALVAMLERERQLAPGARILAVLGPDETDLIPALFEAGTTGFVRDGAAASEFHMAARTTLDGGAYLSLDLIDALLTSFCKARPSPDVFGLTAREREILTLIAVNMSNKDIARKLDLSVRTVETHRLNIRKKTNAGNWRELSQIAGRLGLLGDYPLPAGLAERPAAPGFHEK